MVVSDQPVRPQSDQSSLGAPWLAMYFTLTRLYEMHTYITQDKPYLFLTEKF